ncbi:MAG: major facilitator superfamily protein [Candidatus Aramenus sulfurataquae]|uniref:Major facilitator superfamily protein n=1 Tax=Candidatus Aramenus sulfurataquae TaxID=1326980 RepID=W7KLW2_9CREN|nr:MAG: major facilitator superfamily protein [Candidatus Aramenus sulfurataquae]
MDYGFKFLVASRVARSIGLIFVTLSSSLYLSLLGLRPGEIGLVFAGVIASTTLQALTLGALGDRKGYKKALLIGEGFAVFGTLVISLTSWVPLVVSALIVAGIGGTAGGARGVYSPGLTALVMSNWSEERERVKRIGLLTSVSSISAIGGSLMLSLKSFLPVKDVEAYRLLFAVAFVLLLTSFTSLLFVKEAPRPRKTTAFMRESSLRYVAKVIAVNSLGGFGLGLAIPLLPLWFSLRFHLSSFQIGLVFTGNYVATSLGSVLATKSPFEALRVASITRLLNGVFLMTMALSPFPLLASALYVARGFNAGFGAPNRTVVNVRGIHEEDYGTASSLQGVATRISQLSSGLGGYLMEVSIPLPLLLGGAFQAASGYLYPKLLGGKNKGEHHGYDKS